MGVYKPEKILFSILRVLLAFIQPPFHCLRDGPAPPTSVPDEQSHLIRSAS